MERFFLGTYSYSIDSQRRVPLPKEWRNAEEPPSFVLLPGHHRTIHAMPEDLFREEMLARAKKISIADAEGQRWLKHVGSAAFQTSCDKQGRIKISPKLMAHAQLSDQTVMVGGMTTVQLMSPEVWEDDAVDMQTVLTQIYQAEVKGQM